MSQPLSELCTLLVDNIYGELSSRVFALLIRYGRLSIPGLLKYSEGQLTPRQLKHGLVVLIQQHLVLHYTAEDDDVTYYETSWHNAYGLVRIGKIVQFIEGRYGDIAGGIATNLLLLGHVSVKDLADAYGVRKKKRDTASMNGHSQIADDNHIQSLGQLHAQLQELEQGGYIVRVDERHFRPADDITAEAERQVRVEWRKDNGIKKDPGFNEKVRKLKRKWRGDDAETNKPSAKLNLQSFAAVLGDDTPSPSRKKRKLNGARSLEVESDEESGKEETHAALDEEAVFRISQEKCEVAMRNQRLIQYAARYIGNGTAKVYEALLRCIGDSITRCRDDLSGATTEEEQLEESPWATTMAVVNLVDKNVDLSFGTPKSSKHKANRQNGINGYGHDSDDGETPDKDGERTLTKEQKRIRAIDQHLELLCMDPRHFVTNAGRGKWKVNFRSLMAQLLNFELETTIGDRFGTVGAVAMRIMRDKGKLDEKQICNFALMRTRDMRSKLSQMQQAGYVENQEIPKDGSRQPSRTMYLWYFDADRCRQLILTDTYKSMSRILQRIRTEKSVIQPVLDKANRTDIKGDADAYLSLVEKTALYNWITYEEKLLAQLSRQDDLVAVLRDFNLPWVPFSKEES